MKYVSDEFEFGFTLVRQILENARGELKVSGTNGMKISGGARNVPFRANDNSPLRWRVSGVLELSGGKGTRLDSTDFKEEARP